jgi:hypothetical protein
MVSGCGEKRSDLTNGLGRATLREPILQGADDMPMFRVEGASKETGDDVAFDVEAVDEVDARNAVADHTMVSSVTRLANPVVGYATSPSTPSEDIAVEVPEYGFLRTVAGLTTAFGIIAFVLGGAALLAAVAISAMNSPNSHDAALSLGVSGAAAIAYGVFVAGVGQAMQAVRDMAVNSFHIRNSVER